MKPTLGSLKKFTLSLAILVCGSVQSQSCNDDPDGVLKTQVDAYLAAGHPALAYGHLRTAADLGSGAAYELLSEMFINETGVHYEKETIKHLNYLGARLGNSKSLLKRSIDAREDGYRDEAEHWLDQSISCGNSSAMLIKAKNLIEIGSADDGVRLINQAASVGLPEAMYMLGEFYTKGEFGYAKDEKLAFYWYYKASEAGNSEAMAAVANSFNKGLVGKKNPEAAIHWYYKAAKKGHVPSITAYAWMLSKGIGVQKNKDESDFYFRMAGDLGDEAAMKFLQTK